MARQRHAIDGRSGRNMTVVPSADWHGRSTTVGQPALTTARSVAYTGRSSSSSNASAPPVTQWSHLAVTVAIRGILAQQGEVRDTEPSPTRANCSDTRPSRVTATCPDPIIAKNLRLAFPHHLRPDRAPRLEVLPNSNVVRTTSASLGLDTDRPGPRRILARVADRFC